MAAPIEPYLQVSPLAWNRDRSIPPSSYVVPPTCDRDNEGWAPYSCPHLGCDGFTFDTAPECHDHDDRHHSLPYWCGECDTTFAAQSALERHMSASGHTIWICREAGCDMEGIQFANREAFVGHALESLSHRAVKLPRRAAAAGHKYYQGLLFSDDEEEEAAPEAKFTEKFLESCLEPCCHKHEKVFHSSAEWERHVGSLGHTRAGKLGEELRALNLDGDELARRQAAARERRCDAVGCQHHGRVFASSQTYSHHIGTRGHVDPRGPRPVKTAKTGIRLACVEPECPLVGKEFRHMVNYQRHVGGVEHKRAVRFSEAMRRFGPTPPSPTDSEATEIDATLRTPTKMSFVMMPVTPTSPWMPLSSPVSAVSGRDEDLERRNRELEEMVEVLQRRVSELEATRDRQ